MVGDSPIVPFLLVFIAAFGASFVLTPLVNRLSHRWSFVAKPGGRRAHEGAVPKLGGLSIFVAFSVGAALAWRLLPPASDSDDAMLLRGVFWGSLVTFLGGIFDDRWELPAWALFAIQTTAAAVAMAYEVFIERFTDPFSGQVVPIPWTPVIFLLTLLWIVGMVNTVNFLDGLDGLAAGVGTIAAVLFAWHGYRLGQTTVAAVPLALAGALLGFLPFNFAPAKIFLGSAGAYFLGYGLATMSVLSPAKIATALLVLAVPIIDVAWQIFDRIRRGQSPFRGDRGHLHFRLSDFGLPTRHIVVGYYVIALVFGCVAIFATGLAKLLILFLLGLVVLVVMVWLTLRAEQAD